MNKQEAIKTIEAEWLSEELCLWDVLDIVKGNDIEAVKAGLLDAKSRTGKGKPVCILLHTEMGNGVDFMMNTHAWHGKAPNDEQLADALGKNVETLGDY